MTSKTIKKYLLTAVLILLLITVTHENKQLFHLTDK